MPVPEPFPEKRKERLLSPAMERLRSPATCSASCSAPPATATARRSTQSRGRRLPISRHPDGSFLTATRGSTRTEAVRGGGGPSTTRPAADPAPAVPAFLYEPAHGLPVVRETLDLGSLLSAIRRGDVSRVYWFTRGGVDVLEGPCLVVRRDGTVAQSFVPAHAGGARVRYAMETHGVVGALLRAQPSSAMLAPPWRPNQTTVDFFTRALPAAGLVGVLVAAKYAAWSKGDADDRALLRKKAAEARDAEKAAARALEFRLEAEQASPLSLPPSLSLPLSVCLPVSPGLSLRPSLRPVAPPALPPRPPLRAARPRAVQRRRRDPRPSGALQGPAGRRARRGRGRRDRRRGQGARLRGDGRAPRV